MGGYYSCKQKVIDSHVIQERALFIPVKKFQRVVYSRTTPNKKIIKHDPFLSLYLVEDPQGFAYPFRINMRTPLGTAAVRDKSIQEGKIVNKQVGLNSFATFNECFYAPSIVTNSCCALEGIATPEGIIEKEYIAHFIKEKDTRYSDIGIRVQDGALKEVLVNAVDPFMENNPFKKGDRIVKFDKTTINSAAVLMQKILFSKVDSTHIVQVKRGLKLFDFSVKTYQRYGGGYISDTFLEQKGIFFDKRLAITGINKEFKSYGLEIGDRLLQVNGVKVNTQKELKEYIENYKEFSSLLFTRNGFEFFVNIK